MSSENEFNNRIEEIDFGKFINGNDNTKDANFIQASSSNGPRNVSANINFSLVNSNNNATDDITFDQLASDNISQNKECIDYDGLTNKSNNSDTEGINSKQSYSNHDSSTNEDKVLEGIDQESNEGFLKTIKKQKKALKKSIKEDMDKIEQLKVGIQEKQEQIGSLNEVKEELEKKDILKKKRLLLDLSGQPVPKKLTAERKTLVMEEYEKKTLSVKELCVKYKISRTTFYTLKKKCDDIKKGIIKEKVCIKGRTSKINKDQMGILYYEIISQPKATFTTRELTNMMNESFNFNISESTIRRALQRAKNGWKTEAKIPDGWNEPNILELRKKFVQHLPDYGRGKTEFYLGECTFNLEENIGYSWALKGRKKILANRKRQKPLHLILAINKVGDVIKMYINRYTKDLEEIADDTKMKQFFNENITDLKNSAIYLDNLSFHMYAQNNEEFSNMLEMNNVSFIHYPPCSIFMNPIEYFVNEIYKYIKDQAFKTREQLIYLIENGIVRNTEQEKIQLFINRANLFNQSCLNNESINGFILPDNQLKSI